MTQIIQVGPNGSITLPKAVRSRFKPNDEVIVFASEDTVVLKRIHRATLSEFAHRAKDKPMPVRDIVGEIQEHRRERRNRA